MELNETFKVKIDSFDINGYGVCHIDKKIVFVEGAMEGAIRGASFSFSLTGRLLAMALL